MTKLTPKERARVVVDEITDYVAYDIEPLEIWGTLGKWIEHVEERLAKLESGGSLPIFSNPCTSAPAGSYTHTYVVSTTCTAKEIPPGTPCMWCGQPCPSNPPSPVQEG